MESIMMIGACLFLSLYTPYAVCSLLVAHYKRQCCRIGLGPCDSLVHVANKSFVLRGAKVIVDMRKTICGAMFILMTTGLAAGFIGGVPLMLLFWLCELVFISVCIDLMVRMHRTRSLGV